MLFDNFEYETTRPAPVPTTLRMRVVKARILWPALGFPAVIAPRTGASGGPAEGDATRCICVLVVSDKKDLNAADASRYLRYVPWGERTRRNIRDVAFAPGVLTVRPVVKTGPTDDAKLSEVYAFGGRNGILVSLAAVVRKFYADAGLGYLHEIRVSEAASARLAGQSEFVQYQLFWNSEDANENVPSGELRLLLERFAAPRRRALGQDWEKQLNFLLDEYRLEFGSLHKPYSDVDKQDRFTEVLHPLFVYRTAPANLRIGHVTDIHLDTRHDVYENNLRGKTFRGKRIVFNNWNQNFPTIYREVQEKSDVLLLTGDLIDYGRGHTAFGRGLFASALAGERLGNDAEYHVDRNWFLFYYLLASRGNYRKPAYTILGNHDWRLNPYPPRAPGAPYMQAFAHNHQELASGVGEKALEALFEPMHGRGHQIPYGYLLGGTTDPRVLKGGLTGNLDKPESPVYTHVESVAWYLMLINPFLDYRFAHPGGHQFLMLDWAEDEEIYNFDEPRSFQGFGQRALRSLTSVQRFHVDQFTSSTVTPGRAKVLGIHAPIMGPYSNWYDEDLLRGEKIYKSGEDARLRRDFKIVKVEKHTTFAIRPKAAPLGVAADYGSIVRERDALIRKLAAPSSGVRLVLAGHIHRDNLLVAFEPESARGQLAMRAVVPQAVKSVRPPGVAVKPIPGKGVGAYPGPLYVNTTSAGPRGGEYVRSTLDNWPGNHPTRNPGFAIVTLSSDGTVQQVANGNMGLLRTRAAGAP